MSNDCSDVLGQGRISCLPIYIYIGNCLVMVRKIPWRRKWQPTPVFLSGESHGGRSLVGYSPQGRKESDTTEVLHYFTKGLVVKKRLKIGWSGP